MFLRFQQCWLSVLVESESKRPVRLQSPDALDPNQGLLERTCVNQMALAMRNQPDGAASS